MASITDTVTDSSHAAIVINTADVDISIAQLRDRYRDVDGFSGGAMLFSQNYDGKLYTWTIQRDTKDSSYGHSWEFMGGAVDSGDATVLDAARRECKEEGLYWPKNFASRAVLCFFRHKDRKTKKELRLASLTFIIVDDHQKLPQRVWSKEHQGPVGTASLTISSEHVNGCWMTEEQIRNASLHEKCSNPRDEFNMLKTKVNISIAGFEIWREHQDTPQRASTIASLESGLGQ